MIDIKGLDKAEVLLRLYNASKPLGLGMLHYNPNDMSREEALEYVNGKPTGYTQRKGSLYFDYLQGRVMKVELSGDQLDPALYDRDNGDGAAERALKDLIVSKS